MKKNEQLKVVLLVIMASMFIFSAAIRMPAHAFEKADETQANSELIVDNQTHEILSMRTLYSESFLNDDGAITKVVLNTHDLSQVQQFLEQKVDSKTNGSVIFGTRYDVDDPSTWVVDKDCIDGYISMYCNDPGDNRPFIFDEDGYLAKINLLYHFAEEHEGIHADGIRSLPVGGSFIFDGCTHLCEVLYRGTSFNEFILDNVSPDFGKRFDCHVENASVVYIPGASQYVSFASMHPVVSAIGYYDDGTRDLKVIVSPKLEDGTPFIGWYDRFINRLYTVGNQIDISTSDLLTCNLIAVYENDDLSELNAPFTRGDLTFDHRIDTADAVAILKFAAEILHFTNREVIVADCSGDGKVNTADAVLILKYAAGIITSI